MLIVLHELDNSQLVGMGGSGGGGHVSKLYNNNKQIEIDNKQ